MGSFKVLLQAILLAISANASVLPFQNTETSFKPVKEARYFAPCLSPIPESGSISPVSFIPVPCPKFSYDISQEDYYSRAFPSIPLETVAASASEIGEKLLPSFKTWDHVMASDDKLNIALGFVSTTLLVILTILILNVLAEFSARR